MTAKKNHGLTAFLKLVSYGNDSEILALSQGDVLYQMRRRCDRLLKGSVRVRLSFQFLVSVLIEKDQKSNSKWEKT